ncbi:response regulator [Ruegeria sediminis]|uniref:Response regulator n=1 Tax=Ruegeria sediminis TaxID=2583820 RepID=A0ABY2WSZ1_9RHOB|nr:response regulator [Ruegeria sediminis]TMV03812.1 response regulator [Ruegeria sediminis]
MNNCKQIVHVDDDEDILAITRMSLELIGGFEVTQYGSAKEALENLPRVEPDLFLLDVMMPGMDGPELLAEIRKHPGHRSTPVVFMTAKADPAFSETLVNLGALACITKPFDPVALPEQLVGLLDERHRPSTLQ